jgi:hypothetical protein
MQPLTRGPQAGETKTHHDSGMATPRVRATVKAAAATSSAFDGSTCAAAHVNMRSSPLGADMVCKSGNSSADALFTQGLMALM